MALTLNTNMMALNASRKLGIHYNNLSTSVRRLSSGLRIGSAADDAAGLAVRELMRGEIASLNQGIRNASDAISLIQTADGALGIIDEKLIRMKELAEQAATGTYNSDQRLMIHSEFQAMAAEIDRIAMATEFNGVKLLDGSRTGAHDGSRHDAIGALKVHFGTGNDSAEDYYYLNIGSATLVGLGLNGPWERGLGAASREETGVEPDASSPPDFIMMALNDYFDNPNIFDPRSYNPYQRDRLSTLQKFMRGQEDTWRFVEGIHTLLYIPKGTKNIVINTLGTNRLDADRYGDNDMQLFTTDGKHLAGTPLTDVAWRGWSLEDAPASIEQQLKWLGTSIEEYDASYLNTGVPIDDPSAYDPADPQFAGSVFAGMRIWYTGDTEQYDADPNVGNTDTWLDYETLCIDEAKEDLLLYLPGIAGLFIKAQWEDGEKAGDLLATTMSIPTQELAQKALERVDKAIIQKDKIRAHLGAMQNRLENTVSNLQIQAENLQAAESRISDVDVSQEMTELVRNQVLTSAAVAMLAQANSLPQMALSLIG